MRNLPTLCSDKLCVSSYQVNKNILIDIDIRYFSISKLFINNVTRDLQIACCNISLLYLHNYYVLCTSPDSFQKVHL